MIWNTVYEDEHNDHKGNKVWKPSALIWLASLFFLTEELEDMVMSAWGMKKKMKNKHGAYLGWCSFKAFGDENPEEGEVMLQNKPQWFHMMRSAGPLDNKEWRSMLILGRRNILQKVTWSLSYPGYAKSILKIWSEHTQTMIWAYPWHDKNIS